MSFFDIAILLFTLELIFNKFISEKVFLYSLYLAVLTAIAQILTIGYKWQYMPVYFLICLYAVKYTFKFSFSSNLLKIASGIIIGISFIISFSIIYFLPIPEFKIENQSKIKKFGAKNLTESWVTIPHVSHFEEADITKIEFQIKKMMIGGRI